MVRIELAVILSKVHRLIHLGGKNDMLPSSTLGEPTSDDLLGHAITLLDVRLLRTALDVCGTEVNDALPRP